MPSKPSRNNPREQGRHSYLLLHWVTQILESMAARGDFGYENPIGVAFGTANTLLERDGLRVPGTNRLTTAGKRRERELLSRMTPQRVELEYERAATKANRQRGNAPFEVHRSYSQQNGTISIYLATRSGNNRSLGITAFDADKVDPDVNLWILSRLYVPPHMRQQGCARQMLTEFVNLVEDEGPSWLVVSPGGYDMDDTVRTEIYLKLGFKPVADSDGLVLYLPLHGAEGEPPVDLS